jgi:hypothetical protein
MARPRNKEIEPIRFVPVEQVFKPQVKVRATRDLSGWVDRGKKSGRRVKWEIPHGRIGCLDEDKAREFMAKGFVEIIDGTIKPVSEGEAEEFLSTVTTISLGDPNG